MNLRPKKKIDKEHLYIKTRKNKLYKQLNVEEAIRLIKEQSVLDSNNIIINKLGTKIEANCPEVKTSDEPPVKIPIKPKKNKQKSQSKKKKSSNKRISK